VARKDSESPRRGSAHGCDSPADGCVAAAAPAAAGSPIAILVGGGLDAAQGPNGDPEAHFADSEAAVQASPAPAGGSSGWA
jgi:hypothetical protein